MSRCAFVKQSILFDCGLENVNVCMPIIRRITNYIIVFNYDFYIYVVVRSELSTNVDDAAKINVTTGIYIKATVSNGRQQHQAIVSNTGRYTKHQAAVSNSR